MDTEQLDKVFKALADPIRRRVIDRLREQPNQSLFEICVVVGAEGDKAISRQAVSQHLDMLEKAGLVRTSWSGRTKIHSLELNPLREAVEILLQRYLQEGKSP